MVIDSTQIGNLSLLQQVALSIVGILDKEAAIDEATRLISTDNITLFNTILGDTLTAIGEIISPTP